MYPRGDERWFHGLIGTISGHKKNCFISEIYKGLILIDSFNGKLVGLVRDGGIAGIELGKFIDDKIGKEATVGELVLAIPRNGGFVINGVR